jgi:hypothetical protein
MGRSKEGAATPDLKKSTISLPAELYWRFQEEQVRRRLSNQAAVAQAIQQWLEGRAEPAAPRERLAQNQHWHGILEDILASGDQEAISAVQQNLLVFHRLMRNAEKLSSVGPPPL